ncbi:vWA domain-containing protein [Methylophaga sp.]|jgi:mxaC protein|uniref:vWA domain-containing protein n=1 Tax=Methylophaga sp. TaxID=2024840 RepID=UPI0025F3BAFC|nr:vWA domain-containing protein [Methylophaga sp.]
MNIAFAHPWVLVLLLFALLPFIAGIFNKRLTSWNQLIPASNTTRWVNRLIKLLGVLAFISLVLGLAGLNQTEKTFTRIGTGAHIVFVLDRSASMNETFGGKVPDKATPAKSQVARRLLSEFVNNRPHDLFGVVGFSTQPFFISPLTEHKSATQAAINSLTSPGLAFTNVAKGLGMGLSYFEDQPHTGSRVIVLVSDGAATLDHRAQRVLREWFERYQVSLYWFFLRTENGLGITSEPETARDDNPRVMPERYLDQFFRTLPIPYHAYEVDTPESMEAAIHQLDNLESLPLVYNELIPRNDMTRLCFLTALFAVLSLLGIKALEAK